MVKINILSSNISNLSGVGSKKEKQYNKIGVYTYRDLLELYPRKYTDYSSYVNIEEADDGETVSVKGIILEKKLPIRVSGGRSIYEAICESDGMIFKITFFNNQYALMYAQIGEEYIFHGKINKSRLPFQILSPAFIAANSNDKIIPIYPQTAGLTTYAIEKDVKKIYNVVKDILEDEIPDDIRMEYSISHKKFAIYNIHFPKSLKEYSIAKERLVFEELLITQLALRQIKIGKKIKTKIKANDINITSFYKNLPFVLTNAQKRVIDDCLKDVTIDVVMNRLIQGDVGSGKTVVAAAIVYVMCKSGYQSAIMAPTEILANQHFSTFKNFLEPFGIQIGILTGKMKAKEKKETLNRLETGEIHVIIGTHALISKGVTFKNLGLVVTDEQHRFGVKQRAELSVKGENAHTLVMSATPIPRTLGLMLYGDLDISIIDELPPGRQEIKTFLVRNSIHGRIIDFIKKNINNGRQVYIVCPRIEEGENLDELKSITVYGEEIKNKYLNNYRVDVLHGKMKSKEKNIIMEKFYNGETDVLVTTTVIEVGVDVPNATTMVVQNAERFGLSQLHQLRGRVGRGDKESYCVLFSDIKSEDSIKRLKLMVEISDGFKLAEEDLKIRGPGDFFGDRQHGLPSFKIADIFNDSDLLNKASKCAKKILEEDETLKSDKYRLLEKSVNRLQEKFGEISLN